MRAWPISILLLVFAGMPLSRPLGAEPIAVRFPQGTMHGFLALRTLQGATIATGDLMQTIRGNRVTSRLLFRFRDGSVDDDTAIYTQSSAFRLEREHHIQRGPSYPHPIDNEIDVSAGSIISRSRGDDGSEKVTTHHMDLPPDLANGMFLTLLTNIRATTPKTTISMALPFQGIRVVHLVVTPLGTAPIKVGHTVRRAQEFLIKVDLGGLVGVVAPLLGKQPHDHHVWILEGGAPAFIRGEGQLFEGGPVWRIEQIGPSLE